MIELQPIGERLAPLDDLPIGVFALHPDLSVVFWNGAIESWAGVSRDQVLGRPITGSFPNFDRGGLLSRLQAVFDNGVPLIVSAQLHGHVIPRGDGNASYQDATVTALSTGNGDHYALFSLQDVTESTERMQLIEQLNMGLRAEVQQREQAEVELDRFFTLSLEMLCIASFDGYFTRLNPAWEQALGWSDAELTAEPFLNFVHPDDREATLAEVARIAEGQDIIRFENRYRCKSGGYRWLQWSGTPFQEEGLIYAAARDITERKEAEQSLRESEAKLRVQERAMADSRNGILITDANQADHPIVYCNPAFEELTGYSPAEVIGNNCRFLQGDDRDQPEVDTIRAALREKRSCQVTLRNYKKDGTLFWNDLTVSPVRDEQGEVTHFVGIQNDITARRTAEEALRAERDRLEDHVNERTAELLKTNTALADSERRVRLLLDSTSEAIYGLDPHGNCTFANSSCIRMLGYASVDDVLGRNMHELIHHTRSDGSPYPVAECPIFAAFQQGEGSHVDDEVLWRADGSSFAAEYWSYPVREDGKITGAVVTFLDITDRRLAEANLRGERDFADTVINSLPGVFYVFDASGGFLRWNKNLEVVTGYSADELAQMTPLDFFFEKDQQRIGERVQEVFEHGIATAQADYRFKDGSSKPFLFTGIRFGADDRPLLIGIGIDISEQHAAEAAARQHAKRLEVIGEIVEAVLEAHSTSQIADAALARMSDLVPCSRSSVTLFDGQLEKARLLAFHGLPSSRLRVGMPVPLDVFGDLELLRDGEVFRCDDLGQGASALHQDLYTDGLRSYASIPLRMEGDLVGTLNLGADEPHALTDAHLEIAAEVTQPLAVAIRQSQLHEQVLHHAEDLEHRVAERTAELAKAKDRAESADRLKSAFLATMSHELRTPLNSIIGFTGILEKGLAGPLTDEQSKQLGMVMKSARHLLNLINDILDLSKIEAGELEVERDEFGIREAMDHCLTMVRPLAEQKHLPLEAELPDDLGQLHSDQRRVEQVVINLLTNAVKFTETGRVRLVAKRETSSIKIDVIDTGLGIPPEQLPRLFRPFQQLKEGLARPHEGTGLGLSICRKLTELLGGQVQVQSQLGQGSTFRVVLPVDGASRPAPSNTRVDE